MNEDPKPAEPLGPHDIVVIDGFDQFGIPLGEYTAKCGCRLKNRTLLKPCEEHEWISQVPTSISHTTPDSGPDLGPKGETS